jgi:dTDP-4-amino-4,6-dideoxygalactose transaminase
MVGNFGCCEVLSMHATKFFNTFEGGAILTNDDELAERLRLMRNFGFAGQDKVIHSGTNGKMPEISAAMGLVNFEEIDDILERNRENYECYKSRISSIPKLRLYEFDENCRNNYQYIVVQILGESAAYRDFIIRGLHAERILARRYFWPGCHNMTPYRQLQPHAHLLLSSTIEISEQIIVLPTGKAINSEKINTVCDILAVLITVADKMEFKKGAN